MCRPISLTRAAAATQGITLTRASQTIQLSQRGDERYENVMMFDMRLSKPFRFGSAQLPAADRLLQHHQRRHGVNHDDGGRRELPAAGRRRPILSPRIIRVGFSLNF